jgi:hypothetical protein
MDRAGGDLNPPHGQLVGDALRTPPRLHQSLGQNAPFDVNIENLGERAPWPSLVYARTCLDL